MRRKAGRAQGMGILRRNAVDGKKLWWSEGRGRKEDGDSRIIVRGSKGKNETARKERRLGA